MPTAAKLAAALFFAVLGFLTAELIKPLMPAGTQFGKFSEICAGIGLFTGWFVMGTLVGVEYRKATESGVRTALTLVFWALLGMSIYEMTLRSMKLRYDGPVAALQGMFDIAFGYLLVMVNIPVIAALLLGGMLGGVFSEWISRRWP